MDTRKNAPLTPKGREAMVRSVIEGGLTKAAAALQFHVSAKTVAKWVERFRAEGVDGSRDRSSPAEGRRDRHTRHRDMADLQSREARFGKSVTRFALPCLRPKN